MHISGTLVADPVYGLGLQQPDGSVRGVMWPFRWSARREADGIVLVNRAGEVVARQGHPVSWTGGHTRDYDFLCDPELMDAAQGSSPRAGLVRPLH